MLNGKADPHDGELTQFGDILASLPVDVKVGRLLILGHVFGILEDCLIIGNNRKKELSFDSIVEGRTVMVKKT